MTQGAENFWIKTVTYGENAGEKTLQGYCKPCAKDYLTADWTKRCTSAVKSYLSAHLIDHRCLYLKNRDEICARARAKYRAMTPEQKARKRALRLKNDERLKIL